MAEIFLMEDSPSLRRIITHYLRDAEHNVTAFENGVVSRDEEMLSRADVLVTDLSMPEIDGRQALSNIHLLRPDLPVIVMTGVERFSDPVLDTAFGYLHKPFGEHELLELIDKALERNNRNKSESESENESSIANILNTRLMDPPVQESHSAPPVPFCAPVGPPPLFSRIRREIARLFTRKPPSSKRRGKRRESDFIAHAPETTTQRTGSSS